MISVETCSNVIIICQLTVHIVGSLYKIIRDARYQRSSNSQSNISSS